MVFDNRTLLTQLILTEMRWRGLCQATLLACLCSGTLQGGGEQKASPRPGCLQCAQLSAGSTAVCMAHSCPHGTQLSAACRVVCRPSPCSHGTQLAAWHTAGCMARGSARGTAISRRTAVSGRTAASGYTAACSVHICQGTQLSAAAEFQ